MPIRSVDRRPLLAMAATSWALCYDLYRKCLPSASPSVIHVGKLRLKGAGSLEVIQREKAKPGQGPFLNQQTLLEDLQAHRANLLGPPTTPPTRVPPVCSTFPSEGQTTCHPPSPGARTGITNPLQMVLIPRCCTLHWLHATQPQNPSCHGPPGSHCRLMRADI